MPKPFHQTSWILTRQEWVAIRDDKNMKGGAVPKGAASVSLGDALEKFHAAAKKGLREGVKEAKELKKVAEKYVDAVKAKYPQILEPLDKKLTRKVKVFLDGADSILKELDNYAGKRTAFVTELAIVSRDFQRWATAGGQGDFRPSNAKTATVALKHFVNAALAAAFVTDKAATADADELNQLYKMTEGGKWTKTSLEGIARRLQALPANV